MRVRSVTSIRDFETLAQIWQEINTESGQTSPFLTHAWFASCWRAAGPDKTCETLLIEDTAGPLAIFPLIRFRTRVRGLSLHALGFLQAPDTPFFQVPVARDIDEVVRCFLDSLTSRSDWDLLLLSKVPSDSMLIKALEVGLLSRCPSRICVLGESLSVSVAGTWEQFLQERSARFRHTLNYVRNRIHRAGNVTVDEHVEVDPDGPVFADLLKISSLSWKAARGVALATMPGMPQFFRELTSYASSNGWLHLWILRLDQRPLAFQYLIADGVTIHALRSDFDASFGEISPGTYLHGALVRSLCDKSEVQELRLGPGRNEYKLHWANDARKLASLKVYSPTPYGRFLHQMETHLIPLARAMVGSVRQRIGNLHSN